MKQTTEWYIALHRAGNTALFIGPFQERTQAVSFKKAYTDQQGQIYDYSTRWGNSFTGEVIDPGDFLKGNGQDGHL